MIICPPGWVVASTTAFDFVIGGIGAVAVGEMMWGPPPGISKWISVSPAVVLTQLQAQANELPKLAAVVTTTGFAEGHGCAERLV